MLARAQLCTFHSLSFTRRLPTRTSKASLFGAVRNYATPASSADKKSTPPAARGLPLGPVPDLHKDLEDEAFIACMGPLYSRGWGVVPSVQQLNNPDRPSTHQAFMEEFKFQENSKTEIVFPQTTKKFRFVNWTNAASFVNQVIDLLGKEHYRGNVALVENNVVVRFPGHSDKNSELLEITPKDLKTMVAVEELFSNISADKRLPNALRYHYERPQTIDQVQDAVLRLTKFVELRATRAKEKREAKEERAGKRRAEIVQANELAKIPKEVERVMHIPTEGHILAVMEEYTEAVAVKQGLSIDGPEKQAAVDAPLATTGAAAKQPKQQNKTKQGKK